MAKFGEYKKHQNELPYSIKDSAKGSAKAYNDYIESRSYLARDNARSRTITAVATVAQNHLDFHAGIWAPTVAKSVANIPQTSMITKIYNWFLNINY